MPRIVFGRDEPVPYTPWIRQRHTIESLASLIEALHALVTGQTYLTREYLYDADPLVEWSVDGIRHGWREHLWRWPWTCDGDPCIGGLQGWPVPRGGKRKGAGRKPGGEPEP
jgi:hypothetical protein